MSRNSRTIDTLEQVWSFSVSPSFARILYAIRYLADADIGIIAPYHAQCQKLRTILRPFADGVKVGSVEGFQGQERKAILISTVRNSKEFVEYDLRHTLGFVANPRRFNVALTRAQACLSSWAIPKFFSRPTDGQATVQTPLAPRAIVAVVPQLCLPERRIGRSGHNMGPKVAVDEAGGYDAAVRTNCPAGHE
ncbi:AAA domain-containing protein [Gymnopilus junonius]|uniref:AAA domain-containing protein n=1 Tax=Gymnopilus junonius TaxID=109634 RepID=A0A9P5TQH2_GYMJU|nr:AAA domain-containing protein [Gymnopilus junonius]